MSMKNEKFRTQQLSCKKVDESKTRKDDGETIAYEKATFQNLSKTQVVTLKMDRIPDGLCEGTTAVIIFVDDQQKID